MQNILRICSFILNERIVSINDTRAQLKIFRKFLDTLTEVDKAFDAIICLFLTPHNNLLFCNASQLLNILFLSFMKLLINQLWLTCKLINRMINLSEK